MIEWSIAWKSEIADSLYSEPLTECEGLTTIIQWYWKLSQLATQSRQHNSRIVFWVNYGFREQAGSE